MVVMSKEDFAPQTVIIDLTGPDGNCFVLLAHAKNLCTAFGKDFDAMRADMMAGDYEHLVAVLDREFGDVVTLLR